MSIILLEPAGVGRSLLVIDIEGAPSPEGRYAGLAVELRLPSSEWPKGARVDLLGWTAPRYALSMVHRPADQGNGWQPDADLVRLMAGPAMNEVDPVVLGHVPVKDTKSHYSFATDVATVVDLTSASTEPTHGTVDGADRDPALATAEGGAAWSAAGPRLGLATAGAVVLELILWARRRRTGR